MLAQTKGLSPREFRDRFCEPGGMRLRFDGAPGWSDQPACSQYVPNFGCSVHKGRPLACRLYPLGRQQQRGEHHYIYQGEDFPCMDGCPEVMSLPQLTVAEYIIGQEVKSFEIAQESYLELMQNLADAAFVLFLESGLAASGDRTTLHVWRTMGKEDPDELATRLGPQWIDRLTLPELSEHLSDPIPFCRKHSDQLFFQAQESFGSLKNLPEYGAASCTMMGLALHLGRGLGANPATLVEHWIKTAKKEQDALG